VVFRLDKKPKFLLDYGNVRKVFEERNGETLKDLRQTIIEIREAKLPDPRIYGNAGSFFKNPLIGKPTFKCIRVDYREIPSYPADDNLVKIPAAWLIEKAGWKGKRIGNVGTWPGQPLVIVNYGGATGKEILEFSEMISEDIEEKFNITLEREVNVI
jgi:UDP-N-acetylmuramate dehydrogenase